MKDDLLHTISLALVIIGGVNLGLMGLLNLNLIGLIFGGMSLFTRLLYITIGVAAGYLGYIMYLDYSKK
jgi:hypothetical protein